MKDPRRKELEDKAKEIGNILKSVMPPQAGFALFIFDVDSPEGWMSYMSSAQRGDVLRALREFMNQPENKMEFFDK